ncbi:MAG: hypothetical protein M3Y17_07700 [Actinomycetota bacterium]|nr:hypothetical protein [Actinomycetota bacterium]
MTVARQTTKIGPGGELRIAREIRDAARVTDGQQVTIEVSPDDAIVIRHAVGSDGDLVNRHRRQWPRRAGGRRERRASGRSAP